MENQRTTVLLVLDISAAFDTIDFSTLFDRLRLDFGLGGVALDWLRSFLIGRTQYVGVGTSRSSPATCLSGVPKGSVLGPLLLSTTSLQYITCISTSVLTTRSFTSPYVIPTFNRLMWCRIVSAIFHAGSSKTGCYSTPARLKRFCSELAHSGRK